MKAIIAILIFTLMSLSYSSNCSEKQNVQSNLDCLYIDAGDNICCYHEEGIQGSEEKSCIEIPYTEENRKKISDYVKNKKRNYTECAYQPIDCDSTRSPSKPSDCYSLNKIRGGLCCYEENSEVCKLLPYHPIIKGLQTSYKCSGSDSGASFLKVASWIFSYLTLIL